MRPNRGRAKNPSSKKRQGANGGPQPAKRKKKSPLPAGLSFEMMQQAETDKLLNVFNKPHKPNACGFDLPTKRRRKPKQYPGYDMSG